MPQVQIPTSRKQSGIDSIAKGVSIIDSVSNIMSRQQSQENAQQTLDLEKKKAADTSAEQARKAQRDAGIYSTTDLAPLAKEGYVVYPDNPAQDPNFFPIKVKGFDGSLTDAYIHFSPKPEKQPGAKPEYEIAKDFRQERQSNAITKATEILGSQYKNILDASSYNGQNPGPAHMKIIYSYMKLLDPNSSVREGEYATAANARGIDDGTRNYLNNLLKGGKLTPMQVDAFKSQAGDIWDSQRQNQFEYDNSLYTQAQRAIPGVKREAIIFDPYHVDQQMKGKENKVEVANQGSIKIPGSVSAAPKNTTQPQGKFPIPNGKKEYEEQNGIQYKWNSDTGKYE